MLPGAIRIFSSISSRVITSTRIGSSCTRRPLRVASTTISSGSSGSSGSAADVGVAVCAHALVGTVASEMATMEQTARRNRNDIR
jgi:hypothetical protein